MSETLPSCSTAKTSPSPPARPCCKPRSGRRPLHPAPVLPPGIQTAWQLQGVHGQRSATAAASCTLPAQAGLEIESDTEEMNALRRTLVQMLFAEGNHFCPSCEKSGNCELQALGSDLGVMTAGFRHFYPDRPVDASHPDILLDFNRCILCELCVRASCEVDEKCVFALSGRGITKHLVVNADSGKLADTDIALTDKAMQVCPVGVILKKRVGFAVPIGERRTTSVRSAPRRWTTRRARQVAVAFAACEE
jgi:NADH dehydrogenase/NADH:ubiquinone oxidoreductase subunit G